MCPVESLAGADRTPAEFSRAAACRLVGLAPPALARWERAARREIGLRLPATLAFADLLAIAILREVSGRVGARLGGFTPGLAQLFAVLRARPDVQRLDEHVALIGHDFARLAEIRGDHVRCVGDGFIVVPLHPILTTLRDRVFA